MKKIPYGRQEITNDDIQSVLETLRSDFITQGPKIEIFEKEFSKYVGSNYAVAVSNGTAALHLSAITLGVREFDKIITTPISFVASSNCIRFCNGDLVFSDIDPNTYLLDINKVRNLLENSPKGTYKGIITVDFSGRPVDMEAFKDLSEEFNLWILQDSCHSPGGYFLDSNNIKQNCGSCNFSDLAIFSFHPVKHITTGEGGMITTNDKKLYKKLLTLRSHGIIKSPDINNSNKGEWYYEMQDLGYNYRLTDIQASLGISQLKRAKSGLNKRFKIAENYDKAFSNKNFIKRKPKLLQGHAFHLYVVEVEKRKELYEFLKKNNIFPQIHYIPIHLMPYYKKFGYNKGDFPNAENYYRNCLSLPIFPSLTSEEQSYIIEKIFDFYGYKS